MMKSPLRHSRTTRRALLFLAVSCLMMTHLVLAGCNGTELLDLRKTKTKEEAVIEEEKFYWPLTNEIAPDSIIIRRRPISVKIENSANARPQSGLIDADIVYETEVEGGVTRFNAIFHSELPAQAGPVRSARRTDGWVLPQWDSYLIYSGATGDIFWELNQKGLDLMDEKNDSRIWERIDWRYAPHNLYAHIADIPDVMEEYGIDVNEWQSRSLMFEERRKETSDDSDSGDTASGEAGTAEGAGDLSSAAKIIVPFEAQVVTWEWDDDVKGYLRLQDGEPHTDMLSGDRIVAQNVVVLWADYFNLDRGGLAAMFKHGKRQDGNWTTDTGQPVKLSTVDQKPITFSIGKTWFEVVPSHTQIVVE
jgi:hypothetical protein